MAADKAQPGKLSISGYVMRYENLELHNIDGVVKADDRNAVRIQRIPEELRQKINPNAQQMALNPCASEIRLAFEGEEASVTLSSDTLQDCVTYQGPFRAETLVIQKEPKQITLRRAELVERLREEYRSNLPYSTDIFRLQFGGRNKGHIYIHDINGSNIRPPNPDEVPSLRYLAYGTSITQGSQATYASLGFTHQAAWRLGADLINLGMGGSCHCEPEFADYIASRTDWNFATLCLSVNMLAQGFTEEQFSKRVTYMINQIAGEHPEKPVVCITIIPYIRDLCRDAADPAKAEAFRSILREAVANSEHTNLHVIEGKDLLTSIDGLCTDLLHPADNGMIMMGEKLADKLRAIIPKR